MKMIFNNGDQDLEIDVQFDYEPAEEMTWDYPGCDEQVDIYEVTIVDTKSEICLLPKGYDELEERILEIKYNEDDYAKYGYLLDED